MSVLCNRKSLGESDQTNLCPVAPRSSVVPSPMFVRHIANVKNERTLCKSCFVVRPLCLPPGIYTPPKRQFRVALRSKGTVT